MAATACTFLPAVAGVAAPSSAISGSFSAAVFSSAYRVLAACLSQSTHIHTRACSPAHPALPQVQFLQGRRHTWFAGGYTLFNTHEIATMSGENRRRKTGGGEDGTKAMSSDARGCIVTDLAAEV
jgi:hypothetical protein